MLIWRRAMRCRALRLRDIAAYAVTLLPPLRRHVTPLFDINSMLDATPCRHSLRRC